MQPTDLQIKTLPKVSPQRNPDVTTYYPISNFGLWDNSLFNQSV